MIVNDIIKYLNDLYPEENACSFDQGKIGLMIGNKENIVHKISLSLDLTYEVALEAANENVDLIITHHPYFFNPISKIDYNSPMGKTLAILFKKNISVFSMHTNFDVGLNGVNDTLSKLLNLQNIKIIRNTPTKENYLRYGEINECTINDFVKTVKKAFKQEGVRVIGDLSKKIKKVGLIGGSGAHDEDLNDVLSVNLDLYITGEVKLPAAQRAYNNDLAIIEVNHGVEKFALYPLCETLKSKFNLPCFVSNVETDPFKSI